MTAAVLAGLLFALQPAVPPIDRVVDLAGVLSAGTEAALVAQLAAHEAATSNQIAVLTVPSLEGAVLEEYATTVFRTWALGQAGRDNGVLLLIAVADREVRIEVGYGLEGALTDATAGAIIRSDLVPHFREGDFDGGTLAAIASILLAVEGEYVAPPESGGEAPLVAIVLFALFPIALGRIALLGMSPVAGYALFVFAVGAFLLAMHGSGLSTEQMAVLAVLLVAPFVLLDAWMRWTERGRAFRAHHRKKAAAFARARRTGQASVLVDGRSYTVPSSGGGSGGGGFSGGGGSSGGGGASGSW